MEINERKFNILETIIRNYLVTGDPVGSRTISKDSSLGLSSATIRNEMADLEEMGYIIQPHTSAGRIPTDKGYRFYVESLLESKRHEMKIRDEIIKRQQEELQEVKKEFGSRMEQVEEVMQSVVKVLANETNYATMISSPKGTNSRIKFAQLSKLENNKLLVVIVLDGNIIRNKVFNVSRPISDSNLLKLNMMLNTTVQGLTLNALESKLKEIETNDPHSFVLIEILKIICITLKNADDVQIYTGGTTNIFKYPELCVSNIACKLITTLEEKNGLMQLLSPMDVDSDAIRFYIGEESPVDSMKDCSVVTATYRLSSGVEGTIGIIGPKRMDYELVVETLNNLRMRLDELFNS